MCRTGDTMKLTRTLIAALALAALGSAGYAADAPAKKEGCKCCKYGCKDVTKDKKAETPKAEDKKAQ